MFVLELQLCQQRIDCRRIPLGWGQGDRVTGWDTWGHRVGDRGRHGRGNHTGFKSTFVWVDQATLRPRGEVQVCAKDVRFLPSIPCIGPSDACPFARRLLKMTRRRGASVEASLLQNTAALSSSGSFGSVVSKGH